MAQDPLMQRIQDNMREGPLANYRFLGNDHRDLADIIRDDHLLVTKLGVSHGAIAKRLKYFAMIAVDQLECATIVDGYKIRAQEHKGTVPCPFHDNHHCPKQIFTVTNLETGKSISWSALNIHLIERHSFYEGRGAPYRVDPAQVVRVLRVEES